MSRPSGHRDAISGAKHVQVTVRQEPGCLHLAIRDDGRGFDARQERGMGLLGMQERVSHLGGSFTVDSSPGQGASITIELPLPPLPPASAREIA